MDNTEYVLDWHKTLNIQDPWVAKHADWKVAKNQTPFHDFKGFDDLPALTDAQRAIVGAWTVTVSPWTWIYRFDDQGRVKWTDPMNGMSGEGVWTWRDYAGYVELRWQSGTTEKWKLPLNPSAEKGTCVMADGEHKVMAVKTP